MQFGFLAYSNGVYNEILYALSLNKPLKFFSLGSFLEDIEPLEINQLLFEECVSKDERDALKESIQNYPFLN